MINFGSFYLISRKGSEKVYAFKVALMIIPSILNIGVVWKRKPNVLRMHVFTLNALTNSNL